jgi:micrococcal nuclease
MKKRYLASIGLFLIAFVIAAYQGVIARSDEEPVQASSASDVEIYDVDLDDIYGGLEEETEGALSEEDQGDTNAVVTKVVDGDTMDVLFDSGEDARIRFLGVNTPETVDPRKEAECFGAEASAFTKNLLSGERILLVEDPMADERDKYGRLLRNIFLKDGTDVNALLVESGYAYAYLSFPLDKERKAELKQLENEAKEAERGLWAPDACSE